MNSVHVDDSLECPVSDLIAKMARKDIGVDVPVEDTNPVPLSPEIKGLGKPPTSGQDRGSQIR